MIQFYDEVNRFDGNGALLGSAGNPLPVGVQVAFYGGLTVSPATDTGERGYITLGGFVDVTLQPSTLYTATFSGAQAPQVNAIFTTDSSGNASTGNLLPLAPGAPCSVVGYRSPSLSSYGYAFEQTNLWPQGWFTDAARRAGGNAYPVAAGMGNPLGVLDYIAQAILASVRIDTCTGAEFAVNTSYDGSGSYDSGIGIFDEQYVSDAIDSWANDFFGGLWQRQTGMSDAQWIALIKTTLQTEKLTCAGIQEILTAWSPWFSGAVSAGTSPAMGLDTFGGLDIAIPAPSGASVTFMDAAAGAQGLAGRSIIVFDAVTAAAPNPSAGLPPVLESSAALNALLGTPLVPGQFAVYFQNPSNPDSSMNPVSINNPLILKLVSNWKAAGINYISGGFVYPCLFLEN